MSRRRLAVGLFCLVAAAPAFGQGTPDQKTCVQVQIPGGTPNPFACLNQALRDQALAAAGSPPGIPLGAGSPSNATGTFNKAGVAEQYGKNFGISVLPYRPPPPVFTSNLH
jgi:hypothetical protein